METLLSIGEASKILDLSIDTIRRWDKKGLIKSNRNSSNYRVFDLDEIKQIQNKFSSAKNSYKILKSDKSSVYEVVDLFSGAGGTALGMSNAGLKHNLLVEYDKYAAATLRRNKINWNVAEEDIKKVDFKGIKADIVEGGFPCQAFSYAGKKMGFEDTRGTLFFEFARAVNEIKPKIAIGENVRGLLRHDSGRTLKTMVNTLEEIGYDVAFRVFRSQYYDVPQKRERLIILGVRKDLNLPLIFPKENNYIIPLSEALKNVPESSGQKYPEHKKEIMDLIPEGGYWRDLPIDLQMKYMGKSYYQSGGKTGMARRLSWDEPSLTLTTSPAQKQTERCHPSETRPLTVREYARIQTFPDEWIFEGSTNQQYKQIGNAVPVNLGYHLGKMCVDILDNQINTDRYQSFELNQFETIPMLI